jgi:hypothetical protein
MTNLAAAVGPLEFLLREVAQRIQLSKTDYLTAQECYRAIAEYLSSDASPVAKLGPVIYPQGSFRIQSTISSSDAEDRYDIDLMLELGIPSTSDPGAVLDLVRRSLDRGPECRYHGMVEVKRRCVTVNYGKMHLDVTPAVLVDPSHPRTCIIFDLHPARPNHVPANPEGFANWFDLAILPRTLMEQRALEAKSSSAPVPDQAPLDTKPIRLLALQLLKRWRDRRHETHGYAKPPSVLLAKLVAETVLPADSNLCSVLMQLTDALRCKMSLPLREENPRCKEDDLTDRWPGSAEGLALPAAQRKFLDDLEILGRRLADLAKEPDLGRIRDGLGESFGERASQYAVKRFSEEMGAASRSGLLGVGRGTGNVLLGVPAASAGIQTVLKHSFYGQDPD